MPFPTTLTFRVAALLQPRLSFPKERGRLGDKGKPGVLRQRASLHVYTNFI